MENMHTEIGCKGLNPLLRSRIEGKGKVEVTI